MSKSSAFTPWWKQTFPEVVCFQCQVEVDLRWTLFLTLLSSKHLVGHRPKYKCMTYYDIYIFICYLLHIYIYILDVLITCWFHVSPTQGVSSQAVLFSLTPDVEVKEGQRKSTENNQQRKRLRNICNCYVMLGKLTHQQQVVTCECRHLTGPGLAVSICDLVTPMEPGVVHHEVWATPAERGIQRVELGTVMPTSKGSENSELRCRDTLTITPNYQGTWWPFHAKQGTSPAFRTFPFLERIVQHCATLPLTSIL